MASRSKAMALRMRRAAATLLVGLAGATPAGAAPAAQVRYMLWDSIQLPAYRQCAADFTHQNPGITIKIMQAGWFDYWTALSTGFISGVAPDVFVNHLSKYPEFEANELLVDLAPYVRRDKLDLSIYPKGLVEVWERNGHRYGLPKDWDTVALMVNLAHAEKAGVSLAELRQMNWNPKDGGSFEQVIKRLTLDTHGRNALDAAFDSRHVAVYGYQNPGAGGAAGQVEWSHLAHSNGYRSQAAPWALPLHYDDPRLAETIAWLASLPAKGLSASYENAVSTPAMFAAGKVAIVPDGSWMISYFAGNAKFGNGTQVLPIGPSGRRASMLNGLTDSMWVGSKVKEEAWQWIKYLASAPCQQVVARAGVTFPAIHGLADTVLEVHRRHGVDASAFLEMERSQTFLMPIAENGAQVEAVMKRAIESVLLGRRPATPALVEAQQKIDKLLGPRGAAR